MLFLLIYSDRETAVGVTQSDFIEECRFAEWGDFFGFTIGKDRAIRTELFEVEGCKLIRHIFPKPLVGDDIDQVLIGRYLRHIDGPIITRVIYDSRIG